MKITPDMQPDMVPVTNSPITYALRRDWQISWNGLTYAIPAGFECDGMSIPQVLWSVAGLSHDGVQRAAALVHDWCYAHKGKIPGCDRTLSRAECDNVLRDMCIAAGIPQVQAIAIHEAVDKFGWIFWQREHLAAGLNGPHVTYREIESFATRFNFRRIDKPRQQS